MDEFQKFSKKVHDRYVMLAKSYELFATGDDIDEVWHTYLSSFPPGTDPIYINATEHSCTCCKNFIRNLGNVVAIVNGKLESIWDISDAGYPYDVVAAALNKLVVSRTITSLYRTIEPRYGAEATLQHLESGTVKKWNHFHGQVLPRFVSKNPDTDKGNYKTAADIFKRGLETLLPSAIASVVEIIDDDSLYRGSEHRDSLEAFDKLQRKYLALKTPGERDAFVWSNALAPASRLRNSVIGTLVQDISNGIDEETAVRSFEIKVAPANYHHTKAVITPGMVKTAMTTINKLGLETALRRRMANVGDLTVNNVLWVNNDVKSQMKSSIEQMLLSEAKQPVKAANLQSETISIDDFVTNVLPRASSLEVMVKNDQINKFVTITAPDVEGAGRLFKWNNDFGWSYNGDLTDSIKERVKKAGGNTDAPLRVSLSWFNIDDLDISVIEPNGSKIYFGAKQGKLDVDMNVHSPVKNAVENVSWMNPASGTYQVFVNQFNCRSASDVGFVIEIENNKSLNYLEYKHALKGIIKVADFTVKNGVITKLTPHPEMIMGSSGSNEKWGVKTEVFTKVKMLMNSPNYWDDNAVGNKHWFFILEGCKNDEQTRGIYNEFLKSELVQHRKVFEVLGTKTKCPPVANQLSGVGFSSTIRDNLVVRVQGDKINKDYNLQF